MINKISRGVELADFLKDILEESCSGRMKAVILANIRLN